MYAQFCAPLFTALCKQQQLLCLLFLCLHSLRKQQQLIFVTEIFKSRLFSSNTPSLRTRLTELHSIVCFVLPFIWQSKQSDECSSLQANFINLPFRNHTRLAEILYNWVACFNLPFIWQSKKFDECFWRQMFLTLPSRNQTRLAELH